MKPNEQKQDFGVFLWLRPKKATCFCLCSNIEKTNVKHWSLNCFITSCCCFYLPVVFFFFLLSVSLHHLLTLSLIYMCIVHLQSGEWDGCLVCLCCILLLIHFPLKHFLFPSQIHSLKSIHMLLLTPIPEKLSISKFLPDFVLNHACFRWGIQIRSFFSYVILHFKQRFWDPVFTCEYQSIQHLWCFHLRVATAMFASFLCQGKRRVRARVPSGCTEPVST